MIVLVLVSGPRREAKRIDRKPVEELVVSERVREAGELPAPMALAPSERAPAKVEGLDPGEIVISFGDSDSWRGQLVIDVGLEALWSRIQVESAGDASLSGVFTGWQEGKGERVILLTTPNSPRGRVETFPSSGEFKLEGLVAGEYHLIARTHDGDDRFGELRGIQLAAGEHRRGLVIQLEPVPIVWGAVTDQLHRRVPLAEVRFQHSERAEIIGNVCDENGSYRAPLGTAGRYLAYAECVGYLSPPPVEIELSMSQVATLDLVLERGTTLHGRTSDPAGRPIAGVSVFLRSKSQGMNVDSDAEGRFEFGSVRPEEELRIYARAGGENGQSQSAMQVFELLPGVERKELAMMLETSPEIRGVLVDADGVALGGLEVVARAVDNGNVTRSGKARLDGAFTISGLYAGEYELVVKGNARPAKRVRVCYGASASQVVVPFERDEVVR